MSVQGVQGEDRDDYSKEESRALRQRSQRLLVELVRPHRWRLAGVAALVVVATSMTVAGPAILALGIDVALPALRDGDSAPLWLAGIGYILAAIVSGVAFFAFTVGTARVSQAVSSSVEKTSSSEYIFSRCLTGAKAAETSPPTSCVGESLVTR